MSFLEQGPPPPNLIEPTYKLLVEELFVKLDGVRRDTLGTFKTVLDKKNYIIREFIRTFRTHIGVDVYPSCRLIMPDKAGWLFYIREVTLARLVVKMYQIPKDLEDYHVLYFWKLDFNQLKRFSLDENNLRNLPLRCARIIANRRALASFHYKEYTVTEMNEALDQLASATKANEQIDILKPLLDSLSVPELRWFLQTVLRASILVRFEWAFFYHWHPDAPELYKVCNDMKRTLECLTDPDVRLSTEQLQIHPLYRFRPQLSMKLTKSYDKLLNDMRYELPMDTKLTQLYREHGLMHKFFIEEKMDGDRMVLHKNGHEFKFYSRRLKDYTFLYGENTQFGSLTQHLRTAFHSKVRLVILDGEMVAWDYERQAILPFGTLKSLAIQELVRQFTTKDLYDEQQLYPFLLVFDILHLNGVDLTHHPLFFRRKLLDDILNPVPHRLEILPYTVGASVEDIRTAMRKVVSARSEGIMIKHPQSQYSPAHRLGEWVKIKPEYLEKFGENLDLVVVGKIPAIKNSYMCALRSEESGEYLSFCTVANGFTTAEFDKIARLTCNKWVEFKVREPRNILFGTKKPVYWIDPAHLVVLEIKARSIDTRLEISRTYAAGTTLHNLYCRAIREDKTPEECISYEEYLLLKERYHKETGHGQEANRKRRRVVSSFEERNGSAMKIMEELTNNDTPGVTLIFRGYDFVVLSDHIDGEGERISRDTLVQLIRNYGGGVVTTVDTQAFSTTVIITERNVPSCRVYESKGYDLIRPTWILECIGRGEVVPLEPLFLFSLPRMPLFALRVDQYGDSYTVHTTLDEVGNFVSMADEEYEYYKKTYVETGDEENSKGALWNNSKGGLWNNSKDAFHNATFKDNDLKCENNTINDSFKDLNPFDSQNVEDLRVHLIRNLFHGVRFYVTDPAIGERVQRFGGTLVDAPSESSFVVTDSPKHADEILSDFVLKWNTDDVMVPIPSVVLPNFVADCIERGVLLDGDDYKVWGGKEIPN